MSVDERVARLEETLFFQERLLDDLNTSLLLQQRRIDILERTAEETRLGLEELRLILEAGTGPANMPPPHYL